MPRRLLIFALLVTIVFPLAAPPANAARKPSHLKKKDYKHEIEDLEQQWRTAQIAGDVFAMDRLLSDDYVGITLNGMTNTKPQQLDRVRNRSLVLTRLDLTDTRIKLVDSVAIVTCRAEVEGTSDGESISGTVRYLRVYQRLPSGVWKITNFEVTRVPKHRNRHNPEEPEATSSSH